MARRPPWFDAALAAILAGDSIATAARSAGVRRETVSRAMRDPDSAFAKELAQLRATATTPATDQDLTAKAAAVITGHLDGQDPKLQLDAAKAALTHAARTQAAAPEPEVEEEVSVETALKELATAMPTIRILLRQGPTSPGLVDELRQALRGALADLDEVPAPAPPAPPAPAAPPRPLLN